MVRVRTSHSDGVVQREHGHVTGVDVNFLGYPQGTAHRGNYGAFSPNVMYRECAMCCETEATRERCLFFLLLSSNWQNSLVQNPIGPEGPRLAIGGYGNRNARTTQSSLGNHHVQVTRNETARKDFLQEHERCQRRRGRKTAAHVIIMKRVRDHFAPELLNRLSAIIMFNSLAMKQLEKISCKSVRGAKRRFAAHCVRVILESSGAKAILAESYDRNYGARPGILP